MENILKTVFIKNNDDNDVISLTEFFSRNSLAAGESVQEKSRGKL